MRVRPSEMARDEAEEEGRTATETERRCTHNEREGVVRTSVAGNRLTAANDHWDNNRTGGGHESSFDAGTPSVVL